MDDNQVAGSTGRMIQQPDGNLRALPLAFRVGFQGVQEMEVLKAQRCKSNPTTWALSTE